MDTSELTTATAILAERVCGRETQAWPRWQVLVPSTSGHHTSDNLGDKLKEIRIVMCKVVTNE